MYAADMVVALLAVLVRGHTARPYNIGSSSSIKTAELASLVRCIVAPEVRVIFEQTAPSGIPSSAGDRYVPATTRLDIGLGVETTIMLPEAIRKTATWYRQKK